MLLKRSNFRIVNLEGPCTDSEKKIPKSGPHIKASTKSFKGIKELDINLVGLANNHIMDYGEEGLYSTIELCRKYKIDYLGAGKNLQDAMKMYIKNIEGVRVGVVAFAEHEFSIAKKESIGACDFDDLDTPDYISELKKQVDYLIVLYHGGKEKYRYPSPVLRKRCRKIVEKGGDLVLVQHTHCIGCKEEYNGAVIVYGQGNMLLSLDEEDDMNNNGLLVEIDLYTRNIIFHVVMRDGIGVRLATKDESIKILEDFYNRSYEILDDKFIETNFDKFCEEMLNNYQKQSLGRVASMLNKLKLPLSMDFFYKESQCLNILNNLRCESHREVYIRGLENKIGI